MKKLLCILLCVVLALGSFTASAYAQPRQASPVTVLETEYPVVIVRGMDFTGLTQDIGTDEEQPAIRAIDFKGVAKAVLSFLWRGITTFNLDNAMTSVVDFVEELLGYLACDTQGNSVYNVTTVKYPLAVSNYPELYEIDSAGNELGMVKTLSDTYGPENVYFYVYDWRLDPYELADDLDAMINLALSEHPGAEKVNVICASMGGMQMTVYMSKHGYSKLNKVLFMSAAFCGAYVPTDLFQGKVLISEQTLYNFLEYPARENAMALPLVKIASKIGVFRLAAHLAKLFTDRYAGMAYSRLIIDTFGTMPGFWALVLEEEYDECMEFMFPDTKEKYAGVIEKADRLRAIAQGREAMLRAAVNDGVQITVVANYDVPLIPVYKRACANGDGTLETAPMSGFARVADYGKTLDVTPGRYVSPDRVVDATDCMFPNQTWFVKGAPHVSCSSGTQYGEFMLWLLEYEGQPTVDSSEKYPQFLKSDTNQTISILK